MSTTTLVVARTHERARRKFREWERALAPALTAVRHTSLELEIGSHRIRFMSSDANHAYRGLQLEWAIFDDDVPWQVQQEVMIRVRP